MSSSSVINIQAKDENELKKISEVWASKIIELHKSTKNPTVLLLFGEMGAGKTTFTRYLVEALGGSGVASPTYAFHHTYPTQLGICHHWDLYRIRNEEELESVAFWDLSSSKASPALIPVLIPTLIVVEWGKIVQNKFPQDHKVFHLNFTR